MSVTREQIELALNDDAESFKTKGIDYAVVAISLLRERIPYDVCKAIISCAKRETIHLCDVDKAIPYLTEEDLQVLADCNCFIDDYYDCIGLFV